MDIQTQFNSNQKICNKSKTIKVIKTTNKDYP